MLSHGRAEGGWLSESLTQGLRKYAALGPILYCYRNNQFLKPPYYRIRFCLRQLLETVS